MEIELHNDNLEHLQRLKHGEKLATEGDTRRGVGLNEHGLPDIAWCAVRGGNFVLNGQNISIADFKIAKYPVTYAQYDAFVREDDAYHNPQWWQDFPEAYQQQVLLEQNQAYTNHPRDRLSWYQAVAFSRWLNAKYHELNLLGNENIRLPYEWEWQWAAQGDTKELTFPFGGWNPNCANTSEANLNRSIAVGMYPHGSAACGAMDMAGNVWEWCLNDYENFTNVEYQTDSKKVRRGGSYNFPKTFAQNDTRDIVKPETRSSFNGMRLGLTSN